MDNVLIEALSKELKKFNLGIYVKKETNTKLRCYLYDLNNNKKFDVDYRKTDLYTMKVNNTLNSFAQKEKQAYDMANKLSLLRS